MALKKNGVLKALQNSVRKLRQSSVSPNAAWFSRPQGVFGVRQQAIALPRLHPPQKNYAALGETATIPGRWQKV